MAVDKQKMYKVLDLFNLESLDFSEKESKFRTEETTIAMQQSTENLARSFANLKAYYTSLPETVYAMSGVEQQHMQKILRMTEQLTDTATMLVTKKDPDEYIQDEGDAEDEEEVQTPDDQTQNKSKKIR